MAYPAARRGKVAWRPDGTRGVAFGATDTLWESVALSRAMPAVWLRWVKSMPICFVQEIPQGIPKMNISTAKKAICQTIANAPCPAGSVGLQASEYSDPVSTSWHGLQALPG
jgi:hypothetical protein